MKKVFLGCLLAFSALSFAVFAAQDEKKERKGEKIECCCKDCTCKNCTCKTDCSECKDCRKNDECRYCRDCDHEGHCCDYSHRHRRHHRGGCCGGGC